MLKRGQIILKLHHKKGSKINMYVEYTFYTVSTGCGWFVWSSHVLPNACMGFLLAL